MNQGAKSWSKSLPQTFVQTFGQKAGAKVCLKLSGKLLASQINTLENKSLRQRLPQTFWQTLAPWVCKGRPMFEQKFDPKLLPKRWYQQNGVADVKSLSKSLPQTFTQTFTQAFMIPNPVQFGSSPNSKSNQPRPLSTQFHQEQRPNWRLEDHLKKVYK